MIHAKAIVAALSLLAVASAAPVVAQTRALPPRYDHVFVIVEENKDYAQVLDGAYAPNLARLAKTYGNATMMFGEVHPSEANYVAMLAGDTFGMHDDDAYYCRPGMADAYCGGAMASGYVSHTVRGPHLGAQLEAAGATWKGYYEGLPTPGSGSVRAGEFKIDGGVAPAALYASKHSGFMNFATVQSDPRRAEHIVGFDQLDADLAAERLPTFALIVPNQCNEMHGLHDPGAPADCDATNGTGPLIKRGDAVIGALVAKLQATQAWRGSENVAIVVTFDEGANKTREGCCAVTPDAPSNFGGGHIPTVVITNHGPRGAVDATPYNHYSLLRTFEDAFGLPDHLGHAADTAKGVVTMTPLFATAARGPALRRDVRLRL